MPTYICQAQASLLTGTRKADLAKAITRIHADVTGADGFFAQILFAAIDNGDCFLGGKPLTGPQLFIHGHIRAGRGAMDRADLMRQIVTAAAETFAIPRVAVWVYVSELPARAMVEYGHVLPEPGEEAAWLANLPDDDRRHLASLSDPDGAFD